MRGAGVGRAWGGGRLGGRTGGWGVAGGGGVGRGRRRKQHDSWHVNCPDAMLATSLHDSFRFQYTLMDCLVWFVENLTPIHASFFVFFLGGGWVWGGG